MLPPEDMSLAEISRHRRSLIGRKKAIEAEMARMNADRARWHVEHTRGRLSHDIHLDFIVEQKSQGADLLQESAQIEADLQALKGEIEQRELRPQVLVMHATCGVCRGRFSFTSSQPPPTCAREGCRANWERRGR